MADYTVHFNWTDEVIVGSTNVGSVDFAEVGPANTETFTAVDFYTETLVGEVQHG